MVSAFDYHYIFKLIIVGEMGTGKSALLRCFLEKEFQEKMNHTIGVEFGAKIVPIGKEMVKLQIWDTAGQERFRSVTRSYYRGTSGAILVYDITNRQSFAKLETWLQDIRKLTHAQTTTLLIGTKLDRSDDGLREVSKAEGQAFADAHGLLFEETSSKTGEHVETCFLKITSTIYQLAKSGDLNPNATESGVQRKGPLWFDQTPQLGGPSSFSYPGSNPAADTTTERGSLTGRSWTNSCNC
ncbi:Ras- protein Rab-14 [Dimargaris cristalligena]|nr:Ras- protein Rab-14 [Dimargaris cristalligena]